MLILLCLCPCNENNANKALNPKANVESTLWPEWLSDYMSTIPTEVKDANILNLRQLLLLMKGALISCYAVQVDSKSATPIML